MSYRWVTNKLSSSNLQITNPKPVTDNAAVLDAAKTLLPATGYASSDVDDLKVDLDSIRSSKEASPNTR